LKIVG
jgi:dynein heavy chain